MGYIANMLSYPFMQRAFLVGALVALCSALLGVSLVLKRYSMIGDGLSHVGFGSLALATVLASSGNESLPRRFCFCVCPKAAALTAIRQSP